MQSILFALGDIASLYHNYLKVHDPKVEFDHIENENDISSTDDDLHIGVNRFSEIVQFLKTNQHKYNNHYIAFLDVEHSFEIGFHIVKGRLDDSLVFRFHKVVKHTF
jgi:hypothetical protein